MNIYGFNMKHKIILNLYVGKEVYLNSDNNIIESQKLPHRCSFFETFVIEYELHFGLIAGWQHSKTNASVTEKGQNMGARCVSVSRWVDHGYVHFFLFFSMQCWIWLISLFP